ncbi:MAG: hypothetical protein HYU66_24550 [Armatimonadetes bacterium]|nr:hypothetical protein [Armatimonadota bacterium]
MLESLQGELDSGAVTPKEAVPEPLVHLCAICDRFGNVVRQLRSRPGNRPPLDVQDEYDVQYLFHALLHVHFDDIRREEPTPSSAGAAARMDFLLKHERIVVELKMARPGLGGRQLCEQLIIDTARYQAHPDCGQLVCFVYDPDHRIANPEGIERDLARSGDGLHVVVLIRP